jgi:hypothetical protein
MNESTRRGFLAGAGVSVAGAGLAAIVPATGANAATPVTSPAHARGSLVAHVADMQGDTVTLMVGDRETVVRDADLVARLARAASEG